MNKTGFLLILVILTASWVWDMYFTSANPAAVMRWMIGGAIGGLVFAIVTVFNKHWAGVTAPAYCLLQGLFLGGLSSTLEARYPGIVIQAVGLTFGTLVTLLLAIARDSSR